MGVASRFAVLVLVVIGTVATQAEAQGSSGRDRPDFTFAASGASLQIGPGRYQRYSAGVAPEGTVVLQGAIGLQLRKAFRAEIEFACMCHTREDIFDEEIIDGPTSSTRVFLKHHYQLFRPSAGLIYQFRTAGVLRPYVGASVAVDVQRTTDRRVEHRQPRLTDAERQGLTREGFDVTTIDLFPESFPAPTTVTTAHAVVRAGVRADISDKWFVTVEAQGGKRVGAVRFGFGFGL